MIISVQHTTTYKYARRVGFGEHRLMFRPRDSFDQRLLTERIRITPEPMALRWIHDVFGNCVAVATFDTMSESLTFDTKIVLDHTPESCPEFLMNDGALGFPFDYDLDELPDLERSIERPNRESDDQVHAWAQRFVKPGSNLTAEVLMTMTYAIKETFAYTARHERGTQPPGFTLATGKGTCRDFAVLMIDAVRSLGLAARFVSGYIHIPDEGDGPRFTGGGNTHAWCQVYLPGAGWVEFDPTNGIVGNTHLIRVAVARDARQAIPLWGSFYGGRQDFLGMDVNVTTREVQMDPLNPSARD